METNQTNTATHKNSAQAPVANKKMMICKTCGAPMAKSAKKCQTCGAKNPKKKIKKLIVMLVILGIIVGYPAFFIIRDNTSATITAQNGETMKKGKFGNIYHEYVLNDDYNDFVNEYLPAKVVVKGKITEINTKSVGVSSDGLNYHVESGACNVITFEINNETLYVIPYDLYTKADDYDFGKLKVGDKVEAEGTISKSITLENGKYVRDYLPSELEILGSEDGITKK